MSHSWPKYLGGPANQKLQALPTDLHRAYHSGLDKIAPRWKSGAYFRGLSPERQARLFDQFRVYTEAFDAKHGTSIWQGVMDAAAATP